MIFIDSNIPMYATGKESPEREPCLHFIKKVEDGLIDAAASAEVLQEILHRYKSINRFGDGLIVYDGFRRLPLRWLDVLVDDVDQAKDLLMEHPSLSSRDALHVAVMQRNGIKKIVTYDQGFLGIPPITVFLPGHVR